MVKSKIQYVDFGNECTNLAKSGHGYFGDRVDLNVWKSKDETPDVLLTRLMYNGRRHNILGKKPPSGNVVMLITADFDFESTMLDLKDKGCTIL
ncbi:hypothetical protein DY000_02062434 [Brassica cretica]|uniref:NYN domain-containing protein n=1 Tax=Brassica cretica TaxID=69181 RepID=A0ABQ7ATY4_BRACR|nr:hypothetical protein DY000_02062434 [Brassica cretica]